MKLPDEFDMTITQEDWDEATEIVRQEMERHGADAPNEIIDFLCENCVVGHVAGRMFPNQSPSMVGGLYLGDYEYQAQDAQQVVMGFDAQFDKLEDETTRLDPPKLPLTLHFQRYGG